MSKDKTVPTPEAFGLSKGTIAYVTTVAATDLEDGIETPEGVETLYALHDASGQRLALFDNRDFAFQIARQNDLTAVSAH